MAGFLDMLWKAMRYAVGDRPESLNASYVAASVTTSEIASRTYGYPKDYALVSRGVQLTVFAAANLNATACSAFMPKLYRPANGRSVASRMYAGRRVDRKQREYLRTMGMRGPGLKAATSANSTDEIEEVLEHPALDLLYHPDPFTQTTQFFWLLFYYAEVAGWCGLYKGERIGTQPTSLYILPPQYTSPIASKTHLIEAWEYGIDRTALIRYPAEDVIYWRIRVHPRSPLYAMSWLHSVTGLSDLEATAVSAEIARWSNGGSPGMVMTVKDTTGKTTPQQVEQAARAFDSKHKGTDKAGRTAWLLNAEISQYGPKPNEMQYVEGMARVETAIYRAAGIPEPIWKMADSNRASAETADPQWMGQTISPRLNAMAETLTERLLPDYPGTEGWWFAYDTPVREDRSAIVKEVLDLTDRGLLTGNEGRTALGHDPGAPLLDVPRYMGVPLDAKGTVPPPAGDPGAGDGADQGGEDISGATGKSTQEGAGGVDATVAKAGGLRGTRRKDRTPPQSVIHASEAFHAKLQAWMDRVSRLSLRDDGSVDMTPYEAELRAILTEGVTAVFQASASAALADIGATGSFAINRQDAQTYISQHAAELVTSVTDTLKERLEGVLKTGLADGKTIGDIQAEISNLGIPDYSAERIVRTETSFAYNEGARQAWAAEGVTGRDFLLAGSPCPVCDAIHEQYGGKAHPISEPYYKAGDTIVGSDGKSITFERDIYGPPWHPNCRCTAIPAEVSDDH